VTTSLAAGGLSINGYAVGASTSDGVSYVEDEDDVSDEGSAIAIAAAINAVSGSTYVTATADSNVLAGTAVDTAGFAAAITAGDVILNGVDLGDIAAAGDAIERGSQMAAAINSVSAQTGVTATFSTTDGSVELTAADGRNIVLTTLTSATTGTTGLATGGDDTVVTRSTVSLESTSADGITIGDVDGDSADASGFTVGYTAATVTVGAGVSSLDLTTASGSQAALTTLDSAINTITDMRASMGAYQNRLTASISNLETTSMNLSASRSRILDTDYAKETTNLAKSQIIQQAATAMLAQANQSGQSVLALLK
jgi:flagellin